MQRNWGSVLLQSKHGLMELTEARMPAVSAGLLQEHSAREKSRERLLRSCKLAWNANSTR